MRLKEFFACLALCACLILPGFNAQAAGVTNYESFVSADYWVQNNPSGEQLILDAAGVKAYNKRIVDKSPSVYDLAAYPQAMSGSTVKNFLSNYDILNDPLFRLGKEVSQNYKNILIKETNVDKIPTDVKVRYGVTVRRANLRALPTNEGLFYYATDNNFDALQETAIAPCEPLVILHQSANGFFYYVQSYNYRGWISRFDVATCGRDAWLKYVEPQNFLVVTGQSFNVKVPGESVYCDEGTRLQLVTEGSSIYTVKMPLRAQNGTLQEVNSNVAKNAALHKGYLPYTSNNILRSAFKYYGSPYGWGGMHKSVDCSSLVANAYRTVGIFLPRNADEQELTAGAAQKLTGKTSAQRMDIVKGLMPGACLYMDGHTVMYIGTSNDVPYVIHSLATHYTGGVRNTEMRVVVSDLALQRASGNSFLDEFNTAMTFK